MRFRPECQIPPEGFATEAVWWDAWLDDNLGDPPDPDEDPDGWFRHVQVCTRLTRECYVLGTVCDEEDLVLALDHAWEAV